MTTIKSKVLIAGCISEVNNNILQSLEEKVQNEEICLKNIENPMFVIDAVEYNPDLILVSTEGITEYFINIMENLLQSKELKYVPVIVFGYKEQNEEFVKRIKHEHMECLNRPIQMLYVAKTVRDYLKIQKNAGHTYEFNGKKHILVVDDTIAMLHSLRSYLEPTYHVTIMNSGKSALDFLKVQKPDVILLDYLMPEMDGVEVYKKILDNPSTKDIPVFFLTAVSEENKVKECLSLKPNGYILKPVPKAVLLDTLHDFFDVI